jgi:hypothetical protein
MTRNATEHRAIPRAATELAKSRRRAQRLGEHILGTDRPEDCQDEQKLAEAAMHAPEGSDRDCWAQAGH